MTVLLSELCMIDLSLSEWLQNEQKEDWKDAEKAHRNAACLPPAPFCTTCISSWRLMYLPVSICRNALPNSILPAKICEIVLYIFICFPITSTLVWVKSQFAMSPFSDERDGNWLHAESHYVRAQHRSSGAARVVHHTDLSLLDLTCPVVLTLLLFCKPLAACVYTFLQILLLSICKVSPELQMWQVYVCMTLL